MIRNFTDRDTEQLFHTERNRRFNSIARVAVRKLIQMNQAGKLSDLSVPPGNRLEVSERRPFRHAFHPHQLPVAYCLPLDRQWPGDVAIRDYH